MAPLSVLLDTKGLSIAKGDQPLLAEQRFLGKGEGMTLLLGCVRGHRGRLALGGSRTQAVADAFLQCNFGLRPERRDFRQPANSDIRARGVQLCVAGCATRHRNNLQLGPGPCRLTPWFRLRTSAARLLSRVFGLGRGHLRQLQRHDDLLALHRALKETHGEGIGHWELIELGGREFIELRGGRPH